MDTFNAAFFITVGSLVIGFLTLAIKYCLKSKCQDFNCLWGMIKIIRNVQLETQIELSEMEHNENKTEDDSKNENKII
jgi:hypothetical protein